MTLVVGVLAIAALCWLWIVAMGLDMYGAMDGTAAWMMTPRWDVRHVLLLWAMWSVMMSAMMLPTALPVLVLYTELLRRRPESGRAFLPVVALAGGYLTVWAGFSIGATALQRGLSQLQLLTPMMEAASSRWAGALLILAGAYQLTPYKWRCLSACRSPLTFLMRRWRNGTLGALRMGVDHGLYCLGCCWALMLLLFAGGVMNLYVVAALTAAVIVEKMAPAGFGTSLGLGAVLLAMGARLALM